MKSLTLTGPALALLLTVAACGSSTPATPVAVAASSTTTATPSPTPTEISREDAAAQYLKLVKPYNQSVDHFRQVANADWDQAAFSAAANGAADANQTFLAALLAAEWPTDIRPTVEKLVADAAGETTMDRQLASAESAIEASAIIAATPKSEGGATAQVLRLKLGLGEVPVFTDTPTATPSATA